MKFGFFFSIFAFLLILLQLQYSLAVECPYDLQQETVPVKSCDACGTVVCGILVQVGCSNDDLFQSCTGYASDIDYVKSNPIEIYQNGTFGFFSGCGGSNNGTQCMDELLKSVANDVDALEKNGSNNGPYIVTTLTPPIAPTDPNNSNNQNGALNFIGILAIGSILAALIN
uniref:Sodefrin-like factor n=1 Tax=Panagrolaimus sp. ES5 TaxID=591445 RepID=A0AC34FCM2_9BILA